MPGEVIIRKFRPSDAEAVHAMFKDGMQALIKPRFFVLVSQPEFGALLAGAVALSSYVQTGAPIWDAVKGVLFTAGVFLLLVFMCVVQYTQSYIQSSLDGDLSNIPGFYFQDCTAPKSCFWVAVVPRKEPTSDAAEQTETAAAAATSKQDSKPEPAAAGGGDAAADDDVGGAGGTVTSTNPAGASADADSAVAAAAAAQEPESNSSSSSMRNASNRSSQREACDITDGGGEEVIGCIALEQKSDTVAELRRMSVDARWHKRGIGSLLIKHFMEYAQQQGFMEAFLTTSIANKGALVLYRRHGWEATTYPSGDIRVTEYKFTVRF